MGQVTPPRQRGLGLVPGGLVPSFLFPLPANTSEPRMGQASQWLCLQPSSAIVSWVSRKISEQFHTSIFSACTMGMGMAATGIAGHDGHCLWWVLCPSLLLLLSLSPQPLPNPYTLSQRSVLCWRPVAWKKPHQAAMCCCLRTGQGQSRFTCQQEKQSDPPKASNVQGALSLQVCGI